MSEASAILVYMLDERYMLMVLSSDDPPESPSFWGAVTVRGVGRALTREQAEDVAARSSHPARFLLAHTDQTAQFGPSEGAAPTLAMMPGETIWQYGKPTSVDSVAVLKAVADGAESPAPDSALLPVAEVLRVASSRFGEADPHEVEAHFDELVLQLDGRRSGEPQGYLVSMMRLLGLG